MPVTDGVKTATSGHVIQYQMTFKKKKEAEKNVVQFICHLLAFSFPNAQ